MIIHFICRGNSFRSIIAEAYLRSLQLAGLNAMSSGTTAAAHKARNLDAYTGTLRLLAENGIGEFAKAGYGDQLTQSRLAGAGIVICLNERVHGECQRLVSLPPGTRVWSVADIGEPGRIARTETEKVLYRQQAYREIVAATSQLVSEIAPEIPG
jgi:protein-tyrosine-phosphatase